MKAKITKISEPQQSMSTGTYYWAFFKFEDGSSGRTMLVPRFGNFVRWKPIIDKFNKSKEIWLDGLVLRKGIKGMVDADSRFTILKEIPYDKLSSV